MFNISKKITAAVFTIGMMVPQTTLADFYVIPVGKSFIKSSDVKSFNSSCVLTRESESFYTVPEGKAFVVTNINYTMCNNGSSIPSVIELGTGYQELVRAAAALENIKYNVGIVMNQGESITVSNNYTGSTMTYGVQVSVNGYITNP